MVAQPGVFRVGEQYMMIYAGHDAPGAGNSVAAETGSLGVAMSTDGIRWERPAAPIVLKQPDAWNDLGVWGPSGLVDEVGIKFWYSGVRLTTRIETAVGLVTRTPAF